jgi:hypothetical protein
MSLLPLTFLGLAARMSDRNWSRLMSGSHAVVTPKDPGQTTLTIGSQGQTPP